ncbi:excinuclease ABC subunit UvrC [Chiayiivirga flava]|uniref:UvrABC system protein C n=1 Tax=Chiayiivirga flava TaxID=659595 RepID=A0A7W8G279_9GAMM|nr:excinuclease ABC subunit UvrC [Chiayiivirga flava]MBB5208415.1 excinuclease ABC subunit C [Chiayiivirga flava]
MRAGDEAAGFDGKEFARALTNAPGVYRMIAADDSVLYVGKASSLKKRVASYFNVAERGPRTRAMLAQVARMEVTVTRTEGEALLLENQLIKSLKPRYNVLLRDDKSYPYIYLTTTDAVPRIAFYRGTRSLPGRFFGPFPSAWAVRDTLNTIHKLFRLRSCEDTVFRNRSRPCLQYQIRRCSAPCVNLVDPADYRDSVRRTQLFLDGNNDALVKELGEAMERASAALDFEQAARLRDQVVGLRKMQARQYVDGDRADMDLLACTMEQGMACIVLLSFRNGMNLGTRNFFPRTNGVEDIGEVLGAFVTQYYFEQRPPREIVLSHAIADQALIEQVFTEQVGAKVQIKTAVRAERARYLDLAMQNARLALAAQIGSSATQRARVASLQDLLAMDAPPQRIECFDISHTMGEATVASCVVFDAEGPVRAQYRRYNIAGITGGDDFAAMRQALERRFRRAQDDGVLPDLLLIDGGKGQLAQAVDVLQELGIAGVELVGVAKGVERRAGHESLIRPDGSELRPGPDSPGLHLIQQVRDEAHRFAITGHRGRRAKTRERSRLEDIPGIGARRRAMLLKHFGGLAALKRAGAEEIARVEGINAALARRIYLALHGLPEE